MISLLTITLTVVSVWSAVQSPTDTGNKQDARHLFQQTLAARPTLSLKEYISQLECVTALDSKFVEAFYELGRAYGELGTMDGRNRAVEAPGRAIQLAPQNVEYRYGLAKLYWQREMQASAAHEFRQIIQIDSPDARPYYYLALIKEKVIGKPVIRFF